MGLYSIARFAVVWGVAATAFAAAEDGGFFLVRDGAATARVRLPLDPGPGTQLAAEELCAYVKKITGARLPIGDAASGRAAGEVVLLSHVPPDGRATDADNVFTLEARGRTLSVRGNSDTAVLYGVYEFLGELGVRWFSPGAIGESVPRLRSIRVEPRRTTHRPSFRQRQISFSGLMKWHFDEGNWYRTSFDCPELPAGKRVFMRVGRLGREGDIYLNGTLTHRHRTLRGASDSGFAFDVTDTVRPGRTNSIAVAGWSGFFDGISKPWALYAE